MTTHRVRIALGGLCFASLLLVVGSLSVRGQVRPPGERDRGRLTPGQARQQVDELVRDLREARTAAGRIGDRAVRERIEGLLSRAELRARDLSEELGRVRPAAPAPVGPLPAADFAKLLKGLKSESFDDGKLTFVENFASRVPLNCEQAAALMKCFSFDDKRIVAIQRIYPNLVDPQNFNDVLAVYSFPASRAAARKAVGLK